METKVIKIGSSVGVLIPKYVAAEGDFEKGTRVDVRIKDDKIVITKIESGRRRGWAEAFAAYAEAGEDEMLLPDFLDSESVDLI